MKTTSTKIVGWLLILAGVIVVVFSKLIVFPGLKRLVGIETIVGHDNVVYQPDGSYYFTNPAAMIRWIFSVAAIGVLICLIGGWLLFRARKIQPKISDNSIQKNAA
jgi:hypothetical protein